MGKWKFGNNILQFNKDGNFFDSTYSRPYLWREGGLDSLTVCTEIDSNGLFLNRVAYGKYEVKDGILIFKPNNYVIDCNPLQAPACYIYFDKFIKISGDTLQLTTFIKWQNTSNNTQDIWGSWESNYWVWAYHEDLPPSGAPQLVRDSITFYQDSTIFHRKIEGLPYSGILWRTPFTYDPPLLNIIIGNEEYIVTFNENEMHWLSNGFKYNYTRL